MINFRDVLPVITCDKFVINKCCENGTVQSNEIKIGDELLSERTYIVKIKPDLPLSC